jgi:hypothetical protein
MARAAVGLGCAAAALLLAAEAGSTERHDPAAARQGKTTYVRYCVSCRGDGPLARDLAVPVPDLTTLGARSGGTFPLERVKRIITQGELLRGHGNADMPAWGDAFKKTGGIAVPTIDAAISNLGHYIWSLQRAPA